MAIRKSENIIVRVTPTEKQEWEAAADRDRRPTATFIRLVVGDFIAGKLVRVEPSAKAAE
jgi:hypothetical protein